MLVVGKGRFSQKTMMMLVLVKVAHFKNNDVLYVKQNGGTATALERKLF